MWKQKFQKIFDVLVHVWYASNNKFTKLYVYVFTLYLQKTHYFKPFWYWHIKPHHVYFNEFDMPYQKHMSLDYII